MKTMEISVLGLLLVLGLMAAAPVPEQRMIAYGELNWVRASVCEDPINGGYLQYYLTDGCADCGLEVFLSGDFAKSQVGSTIWVEGNLVESNGCLILDVDKMEACQGGDQPDRFQFGTP